MMADKDELKKEFLDLQYECIRPLGCSNPENTWLVNHVSSGKLYIKKQVKRDAISLYRKRKNISNSHIAPIECICEGEDESYIIERYISGDTLEFILEKRQIIPEAEAINYAIQVLDGLNAIHEIGIVHRDITPSNIIISTDGVVKIIDFGISRILDESKSRDTRLLGTYGYAAPEQFGFAQTDARSDIYAVGSLLYRMIYGMIPGDGGFVAKEGPIGKVIQKAMRIDPENRYQSAKEMAKELIGIRESLFNKEQTPEKRHFIPGFRTGKIWKMIVAILLYCTMLLFSSAYITDSIQHEELSNVRNIIAAIIVFWVAPLVLADAGYWSRKAPVIGEFPKAARITIRVLIFFIILIIGIMSADTISATR